MDSDNLQEPLLQNYDWRTVLQQDARERVVNKIMETLKRHLPFSGQEGLRELKKIAIRFEEKVYTAATSQSDYLRKISLKMLTMETKSQNPMANSLQPNAASNSTDPQDPASQNMQSQMQNQVQQLPIPMVSNQSQAQQQLLSQNIQNNIPSTGVPNSAGSTPALPPVDGKSQGTMPSVPVQSPNVQNTFNADPFAQRHPMMQGCPTNSMFQFQSQSQSQRGTDLKSKKKAFTSLKKVHAMKQSQMPSNEALDSSSQTGSATGGDWQEDIYQKIKSMNEMYFPELNEMYQRMANKLQQHDAHPQQPKNEQLEKLRFLKLMLERLIMFLRTNKSDIQPNHKDKIVGVEKQILNILNSNRPRKSVSSLQQGQLAQPHMHAMQQSQQQQPQMSQMHSNEAQMNSQMQPMNIQNSLMPTQQNNLTSLQHNTLSSGSSVSNSRQSMLEGLPSGSNIDAGQGNGLNQMQQVPMNSLQQNSVGGSQQMTSSISSQNGLTALQSNVNSLQSNSNILQPQQIKQEQQMFSTQQLKQQYQQRQIQYMQRQQLIQQLKQQQQQQTSQQQSGQLPGQQLMQLNQTQKVATNALHQNLVGGSQPMTSSVSSQNGLTALQSNSNVLQPMTAQQLMQHYHHQHMLQQYVLRQQLIQQQYQQQQYQLQFQQWQMVQQLIVQQLSQKQSAQEIVRQQQQTSQKKSAKQQTSQKKSAQQTSKKQSGQQMTSSEYFIIGFIAVFVFVAISILIFVP